MGGAGFEPAKVEPMDLQSIPFDRSGNPPPQFFRLKSQRRDLNPQPADYKSAALPIELRWHNAATSYGNERWREPSSIVSQDDAKEG